MKEMISFTGALLVLLVIYGVIKLAMIEREPFSSCPVHMYGCGICFFTFIAMLSVNAVGWHRYVVSVSFINFVTRGFVASAGFRFSQSWLIPLLSGLPQLFIWRMHLIAAAFVELLTIMLFTVMGVSCGGKQSMRFGRCRAQGTFEFVCYGVMVGTGLLLADELLGKHFLLGDEPTVWMFVIRESAIVYSCALYARWGADIRAFAAAVVSGTMALAAHMLYTQVFPPHYAATCSVLVAALQLLVA